jgi:cobalt/nickel transport system permease protein
VQALFFADGGLLALGCNIFNLGFFPAFVAYPFVFKPLLGDKPTAGRLSLAAMGGAVVSLQLGAFGVVMETVFSGIAELPFSTFVLLMQPIHLGIGVVEGLVSAAVISFIWKARPEVLEQAALRQPIGKIPMKKVLVGLGIAAVITGGVLSRFASSKPDGLEWSMFKVSGKEELAGTTGVHHSLGALREKTAFLPDYSLRKAEHEGAAAAGAVKEKRVPAWPAPDTGASVSGIVGGILTLLVAGAIGFLLKKREKPQGTGA